MYKPFSICLLLTVIIVGCAGKKQFTPWGAPMHPEPKREIKKALLDRSKGIEGVKAHFWAKVQIGQKDQPSVRVEAYWLKAKGPHGATFRLIGLGPFSMTIFEAFFRDGILSLALPREGALYRGAVPQNVKSFFQYVLDPWGIAQSRGSRVLEGRDGTITVLSKGESSGVRATFDQRLRPLSLEMEGVRVIYHLPDEIVATIVFEHQPIVVQLSVSSMEVVSAHEVAPLLGEPLVAQGLKVYGLRSLFHRS